MKRDDIDPLCKLISGKINQHSRLCTAINRSDYFKNKIRYPNTEPYPCDEQKISFKTAEGVEEARISGKSYHERMILCLISMFIDREETESFTDLFISRAYKSNYVFVYIRNPSNGKIYLENISSNISVIDELNSFDFTED